MPSLDEFSPWHYQARLIRVVDGDTFDLEIDLGFHTRVRKRTRLLGIDTAEIFGVSHDSDEYADGITHRQFVDGWLYEGADHHSDEWPFIIKTTDPPTGAYGRWLVDITRKLDGEDLSEALLEEFGETVRYES